MVRSKDVSGLVVTLLLLAAVSLAFIQAASEEEFKPVDVVARNLLEFQITVKVKGEVRYLVNSGDQVLATIDPLFGGLQWSLWRVVPDIVSPTSLRFLLINGATENNLLYDVDREYFYAERRFWIEGAANWQLLQSQEDPGRYKLRVLPEQEYAKWSESDEPEIFYIVTPRAPLRGQAAAAFIVESEERFELVNAGDRNSQDVPPTGRRVRNAWPEFLGKQVDDVKSGLQANGLVDDVRVWGPEKPGQSPPFNPGTDQTVWLYTSDPIFGNSVYHIPQRGRWHHNRVSPGWPELVGVKYQDAIATILAEVTGIEVVYGGSIRPADLRTNRVFLGIDENGLVARTPSIG